MGEEAEEEEYRARANERPRDIARALGVDLRALMAANVPRFPGLRPGSRLRRGTPVETFCRSTFTDWG